MPLYDKQLKIDEIHREVQQDVHEPQRNVVKSIPSNVLLFVGIAAILVIYFAVAKGWNMNKTFLFVTLVGALAILLSMNQKGNRLLTEQECKVELYQKLKFKQRHRLGEHKELPEGTIGIVLKGKLRFFDGKPWKRALGFNVYTQDGREHEYMAEVNPYTADILTITEGYFDPRDSAPDLVYVAAPELLQHKRASEYSGRM